MKENIKKFINGFGYAFCGIKDALKSELNLKVHFLIMSFVIMAGFILKISVMEWIVCIILFALVISEELINTGIEKIVDVIIPEKNDNAKFIKDVTAGAVLVTAICAAIIGFIIFLPKII